MSDIVLVAGAGGFIGGHLVARLLADGHRVRAVDIKPLAEWAQRFADAENLVLDLREPSACRRACEGVDRVYDLAADMGGMGYIETHRAACMLNVLVTANLLVAARDAKATRFFYASSACVYAQSKQDAADLPPLREEDAYPADPEDGYGWEKLYGERLCRHFREDYGLATRIARLHNVYGPHGAWTGGREKAPSALARKVLEARRDGVDTIEVWGDGTQSRTFLYIDDAIDGILALADSEVVDPINLGSTERITVTGLARKLEAIAGHACRHAHRLDAPRGVAGRASDNARATALLGWSPRVGLDAGLARLVEWLEPLVHAAAPEAVVE